MTIPTIHPGEHLAEELRELDLSAASLARQIEVPANRITEILNSFSEQAFLRNIRLLKQIVHCCIKMVLLKYPIGVQELPLWEKFGFNKPIGGFLESPDVVLRLLPSSDVCLLQKISNNDSDVQELSEEIHNMPDLTEEEIDLQRQRYRQMYEVRAHH